MKKSQFESHRRDMRNYHHEFEQTKESVLKENKVYGNLTARITVCCILAVILIALILCSQNSYQISKTIRKAKLHSNEPSIHRQLSAYEDAGEYSNFYFYCNENSLYYIMGDEGCSLNEFEMVYTFATQYNYTVSELSRMICFNEESYYKKDDVLDQLIDGYETFHKYYERYIDSGENSYFYEDSAYDQKHLDCIADMSRELDQLIGFYFHLDEEQLAAFPNLSTGKKYVMLEDAWEELL